MKPENEEVLCRASDLARSKWESSDRNTRVSDLLDFANEKMLEFLNIGNARYERLPEILQMMLALREMSPAELEKFAIEEGYLNGEERFLLCKNIAIAIIAGSIHRGATATVVCPQVKMKAKIT